MKGAVGTRPRDFTVVLPPGWLRLPVPDGWEPLVAKLAALRFSSVPASRREAARTAFRRDVAETVRRAADAGGIDLLLLVEPLGKLPVSAACVVTHIPAPAGTPELPATPATAVDLLAAIATEPDEDDTEVSLVPVAGAMAVRHRYRRDADPGRELGNEATSTHVDYVIPIPGTGASLLLSFSTVTEPVAGPLVDLFDAITSTFRWIW